jgi:putative ABC transport system ATP-binding protein
LDPILEARTKGGSTVAKTIVKAKGIHKTYDTGKIQVHALRGLDLTIREGEMISIMGPSGCGKTTLLNCLSTIDDITEGSVEIEGTLVSEMKDNAKSDYRANNMGFIFQFYNLLPVLNAVENVELPLLLGGVKPKDARARSMEVLWQVGLKEWAEHKPAELSGGQRQRVTIARALVNKPKIVWGDEPTGDLDTENSTEIMDLMCRLNKENRQTFVVVTHDPKIGKRASRRLWMENGQIKREENEH